MSPSLGLHLHLLMLKESVHQGGDPIPARKKKELRQCILESSLLNGFPDQDSCTAPDG